MKSTTKVTIPKGQTMPNISVLARNNLNVLTPSHLTKIKGGKDEHKPKIVIEDDIDG